MRGRSGGVAVASARPATVLIGNGLNRASNGPSWDELLVHLADVTGITKGRYELDLGKPFPLLYEEMLLTGTATSGELERIFHNEVTRFSQGLTPTDLHRRILTTGIRHIITTNYDFTLERAITPAVAYKNEGVASEQRYSLFRRHTIGEHSFWHIHGDIGTPSSIMLGYDHYAGALQKIRQYTASGGTYAGRRWKSLTSRLEKLQSIASWVDLFFITDVHVLGFNLAFVEMHLWWILTYRARKKAEGKSIDGCIRLYVPHLRGIKTEREVERRYEILRALYVEVVEIPMGEGRWQEFYQEAIAAVASSSHHRLPA